ncbi:MAG: sialidase family protein [Pseudomonadota bacterium]|nr:sialidase family protein [Pseudomonadota bacterium]
MSTLFVRPGHLHTPSRVLSASSEAGLCTEPPSATSTNKGALRIRATGTPTAPVDMVVSLQTGGNPYGYANSDNGYGAGAAVVCRRSVDSTSQYRGYIDSLYLARVEYPVPYAASGVGYPSTPRTLANGDLGFVVARSTGSASSRFYRVAASDGTVTTTTITTSLPASSLYRPDLVVLPSGRLLAFLVNPIGGLYTRFASFASDDNGATWSLLTESAYVNYAKYSESICMEYVDDLLVGLFHDSTGNYPTDVVVSRDGGCSFTLLDDSQTLRSARTCVTPSGKIVATSHTNVGVVYAHPLAPGGGFGTPVQVTGSSRHEVPILCRDDGTLWIWEWQPGVSMYLEAGLAVSLDGGNTWADPTDNGAGTQSVFNTHYISAVEQYVGISVGMWQDKAVMLAHSQANTGTSDNIHMLTWGGWESVTDVRRVVDSDGQPYEHTYVPVDYPDAMGWTTAAVGAGATVTNQPWLRIVSTGADNRVYYSPAAFFSNVAMDTKRARFRVRVNSGGSVTDNRSFMSFILTDGANEQEVKFRFSTTSVRVLDGAGNVLGNVTVDQTGWVDWLVAFKHDATAGVNGKVSVHHKRDGDSLWTQDLLNVSFFEVAAGLRNRVEFGGTTGGATSWDVAFIAVADDDNSMAQTLTNPGDLAGRPLGTVADFYLTNGIRLGGRNGGGVPGDTYTVRSTYQFGKASIWRELRPSKKCHSTASNTSWNVVFDAGAGDRFKGDTAAVFGTNFRTATLQLNATDSWGAPAVSVALDASISSGTVSAGTRGPGYFGPPGSPNWRPGQFKSDGDAHRFFVDVAGVVYEVTDNDESRIFVEGVDFSASVGSFYVFQDKMAATLPFTQYRFMRLLVGAQGTPAGDACYHVGTLVFDRAFTPAQSYDHGFVDRIEPHVELFETDAGYRASARVGPRRCTLAIQWSPLAFGGPAGDMEWRLRDFYSALEGAHRPFVFWRDTTDITTVGLYRMVGTYQATNVWNELKSALTRVDQLILEECY